TVSATLSNPTDRDFTVTLSNGATITFAAGSTTGTSSAFAVQGDDVYQDGESYTISVANTGEHNFEQLDISDTATVTVTDTVDTVNVTIDSNGDVTETQDAVFTVKVDRVLADDLVVTLSNGEQVTIRAGEQSVAYSVPAQGDDVYVDAGSVTLGLIDASVAGKTFEDLQLGGDATVNITDTVDTTTLTLGDITVEEGSDSATVSATLSNPTDRDFTVTLSNGATITFAAGATTATSSAFAVQGDDVYQDGESYTLRVTNAGEHNFEQLDTSDTATVTVTDTVDTTTLTLGDITVAEGSDSATVSATLSNPTDRAFTVTLSNGATITFAAGETTGTSSAFAVQSDDVYQDGESYTLSVTNAGEHNFEQLDTSDTATVTVTDTVDTVNVTIESNGDVTEAQDAVFTVKVDRVLADDLVVTLSNGEQVTIRAGEQSVAYTVPAQGDDVYADAGSVTVGLDKAEVAGKTFEDLQLGAPATVQTSDTTDTTTLTLGDVTVAEGSDSATVSATLSNPTDRAFTVTLSNGATITFAAGATIGTSSAFAVQGDDVYQDGESYTLRVTDAGEHNFEQLNTSDTATVTVTDTVDTVNVTIESNGDVTEAQDAVFTVKVDQILADDLVVTLGNGDTVTIKAGEQSVAYTVPAQGDDVYADAGSVTLGIVDASVAGKNFEDLQLGGDATVNITDTVDTTTLTLGDITVAEGSDSATVSATLSNPTDRAFMVTLSNGATITFAAGATTGTSSAFAVQGDDVYRDGESYTLSVTDAGEHNFEQLDTSDTATVTVTDTVDTTTLMLGDVTVAEGSDSATVSATLSNPTDRAFTVTLSNGATISFAAGSTTGTSSAFAVQSDDVYQDGESYTLSVTNAGEHNFEQLDTSDTATVTVTDTVDTVNVTIESNGDVTEAQDAVFTIKVDHALADDLVVTLSNGEQVTIQAGEQSVAYTVPAQGDDVYADAGSVTVGLDKAEVAGKTFEDLQLGGDATVNVTDTVDTTTLTLGDITVAEGSDSATVSATLSNPTDRAFTVTLSNGATITFTAGATIGTSSAFAVQSDDVYQDGESYTLSVTNAGEHNFEQLDTSDTATVTVTDTVDTVNVTIDSNGDVTEAQDAVFTIKVDRVLTDDLVVTLSNGDTVTIRAGEQSVAYSVPAQGDDVYADADSVTLGLTDASVAGKTFEDLQLGDEATVNITDTVDTTTLMLGDITVEEGSDSATVSATLSNPTDRDFTVTLSNGATITFAVGATTATSSAFAVQGDDVYQDGESYTLSITDAGEHNFEQLDTSDTATVTVTDTVDVTTLTLGEVSVAEGSDSATVSATLSNPTDRDFTVTLSNGATITFAAGETTGTSSAFAVQGDDVYRDGESYTLSVANAGEHNFEQLDTSDTATVTVTDTVDTTMLTLGDVTVVEGSDSATVSATLSNPTDRAFTVTLSNGATITFAAGETTGTSSAFAVQSDDVYQDGESYTLSVTDAGEHNFEQLDTSDTATVTVTDTVDTTMLTLGDVTVAEGSDSATVSATLSNPTDRAFTVTLSNGATITFAAGATTGTSSAFAVQGDDVYQDGESYTLRVTDAGEHNFEQLDTSDTATVTITDTVDTTTLTLGDITVAEGSDSATVSATLSNPTDRDFTVTLSNGATITFAAGSTTGTSSEFAVQGDDVYQDGESYTLRVTDAGEHNFEQLDTSDTATVTVTDTVDTVNVTIESNGDVTEAQDAVFTIKVDRVLADDLVVTLSNGEQVTIRAGEQSAAYSVPAQGDDVYADAGSVTLGLTGASVAGKIFEDLQLGGDATVNITDTVDTTTLTLGDVTVAEGSDSATVSATLSNPTDRDFTVTLSNGATITFAAGSTTGTSSAFAVQGDDVYQDGESYTLSVTDVGEHNFEQLTSNEATVTVIDTVDTVNVTIESNGDVTEAQDAVFTIKVDRVLADDLVVTLSNGEQVTIRAGEQSAAYSVPAQGDDVYNDSGSVTLGLTDASVAGKVFEDLQLGGDATVNIIDTVDTTTLTLGDITVAEGSDSATVSATLSNPTDRAFTVTLSNGATITFAAGATTGTSSAFAVQSDDVYQDGESYTLSVTDAGEHNFEQLDTSDTATVTVTDTVDTVNVTIESNGDVTEAQDAVFTIKVDRVLADDLVVTLSNGDRVTIQAGEQSAAYTVPAQGDDVYADAGNVTVGIDKAEVVGKTFEDLQLGAPATVQIGDTVDTTTLTLGNVSVAEGSDSATVSATLSNPTDRAFTVTLSNGATITFAAGATTGTSSAFTVQGDDVYQDGESYTLRVTDAGEHNFEQLDTSDTATVTVTDTVDTVNVTIESNGDVTEAQDAAFTIKVDRVLADDLVVTLSNGEQVTIRAGEQSAAYSVPAQGDDVYNDSGSVTLGLTDASVAGKVFEDLQLGGDATVNITDTVDTTTLTLGDITVEEGSDSATVSATLSNPTDRDFTVTLSNGATITFAVGATTGTSSAFAVQSDDVYQDGESYTLSVTDAGEHNFEQLDTSDTATVTVTDTVDTVNVTIESNGDVTEAQDAVFTIKVDRVLADDLVVTLSNGDRVTIQAGEQSAAYTVPAQGDDVYADAGNVTVGIDKAEVVGKTFEDLQLGAPATVQIGDTVDTTTLTLGNVSVAEGSDSATVSATLSNPTDRAFTVTLSNGATITFAAGATTGTSSAFVVQGDDVYQDGESYTLHVTDAGEHNFEQLDTSDTATVTVIDTVDTTTLTLGDVNVAEGSDSATVSATLSHATDRDFTVTLSNGATITFAAGETTGTSSAFAVQSDDVYQDGESYTLSVTDAGEHNFEQLDTSDTATVTVTDTVDVTTLTLGEVSVAEGSDSATVSATLSNPTDRAFTVTLSNGATITFAAGATTGTSSAFAVQGDDVYQDGESYTLSVTDAGEHNFEQLDTSDTATVTITDTVDTTTLTLGDITVAEGSDSATVSATLSNPTDRDFTVTLSNGATITFAAGATIGISSAFAVQGDDVYQDGESYTLSVTNAGKHNFEQLDTSDTATVTVTDTIDTVNVTIDSNGDVTEAQDAVFTIKVDRVLADDLVVTLSNGDTVTIRAGEQSAAYTVPAQGDDVYADADSVTLGLTDASVAGKIFEDLQLGGDATVNITDTVDTTTLTLGDITVAEGSDSATVSATLSNPTDRAFTVTLSNGVTITFAAGETTGTSSAFAVQSDDVYQDGESYTLSVTDAGEHNFEQLDTSDTATVTVTDTVDTTTLTLGDITVAEGSDSATVSATLSNPTDRDFTVTLSNGATITFAAGETTATSSAFAVQGDDVYQDSESYTLRVTNAGEHNFEQLDTSDTATVTVTDTVDTTTLTLGDITVAEGSDSATVSATLSNPTDRDFTVTLSNGATITFAAGSTTGTSSAFAVQGDDVYQDGESYTISVANTGEHNFEQLDISDTATVTVTDTVDTVNVTIDSNGDVTETQDAVFTVKVDRVLADDLVVTLSNGEQVTIRAGEQSVAYSVPAQGDDVYVDAGSVTLGLIDASVAGKTFEDLQLGGDATVNVTDTVDTTTLTLGDITVAEGSDSATVSATLSNPTDRAFTVTLSNGATVSFAAGETTGTSSAFAVQGDDVYRDGESYTLSVANAGEHNFEQLDTSDTATVTVTDTVDTVNVTIESNGDVTEAQDAVFTIKVDRVLADDLVVTLSNGEQVTIRAGEQSAAYSLPAQGDDVYADAGSVTVGIDKAEVAGKVFEDLQLGGDATVNITDTVDTTTLTLGDITVAEGSDSATVSATLSNPTDRAFTVTLSNGATITFAVGATIGTSSAFAVQGDDVYQDGESYTLSVTNAGEHNFEQLTSNEATVTVIDTVDTVNVTIDSNGDVTEAQDAVFTIKVDRVLADDLVVTLSNGEQVTIQAGEQSAAYTVPAQGDDVYVDVGSVTLGLTDASVAGKVFEDLQLGGDATVNITDTVDTTTLTLGDITVAEGSDSATVSATLSNPTDRDFTVTLSNGATITFAAGATTGTSSAFAVQGDDVYQDGESYTLSVTNAGEHNFEQLDTSDTATVTVTDTVDTTTLTLGDITVAEGSDSATVSATLSNPTDRDFTVTLSNGATISFAAGSTTGTSSAFAVQGDDVYQDGESYTLSVTNAGEHNFEQLDISDTATVTVTDTVDTVNVTIDSNGDVTEAQDAVFTIKVDRVLADDLVVTLSNGEQVTIQA
ncbi:immunoglobulin-like domain-containing protein, partial [Brenneria tiliae]|uniref:immunoglobulin-like domain-containing protein n=5 Tax=Brenneria tiliae TaxID=2914984 RepID=UPI002961EA58